jgi:hypothetical protein
LPREKRCCGETLATTAAVIAAPQAWGATMLGTILVILLILILIGAIPRWGYSSGWGYGPSGLVGVILLVVIILALTGRV